MRSLAIIEPDASFSEALRTTLHAAGFEPECFTSGTRALAVMRVRTFALAIIDLDLRDTDPYAICREISQRVPIITVADACGAEACVHALECGADDCVRRATSGRELVARVHNVLRRAQRGDRYDVLESSLSEMRVRAGGTTHDLTRGEAEVLAILLQHAPSPVTVLRISELLGAKRGTVESRIKSLRRKLGRDQLVSRGTLGYQLTEGP